MGYVSGDGASNGTCSPVCTGDTQADQTYGCTNVFFAVEREPIKLAVFSAVPWKRVSQCMRTSSRTRLASIATFLVESQVVTRWSWSDLVTKRERFTLLACAKFVGILLGRRWIF